MVDEAGYLHADLEQLASKLGAPLGMVERVLATLQTFDPPGVFARSLAECLALQLKEQNRYDPQIARLARQSRICSPRTTSPRSRRRSAPTRTSSPK